ncbi:oligopeptide/dipeptide ABC transporter ATP-binding protein [Jannaschia seohaensis]|uniref:Oligopeptide transport system ATP-binding protein n=1 Tax=Jannaschia seohaensis TaxID=475081 RepID=A0A2Y9BVX6_9RHOB|nr:oligopeptide/dipeptide ABC transporter ATP-binding protein [Jannaschia seohaensis]PWJ21824.1 oligopeptide transport system ATP-binding protein [Jannaschia seohaensis]SSA38102.1 oligopeptide transport system ATP-binding protein [Jannaschia seohaensis]
MLTVTDAHVTFEVAQTKRWPWSPPGIVHAVNGVSFTLKAGRTIGIVGESGCGKSTLIRAVAGLAPLAQGRVTLDGQRVDYGSRASMQRLRSRVQMIFQDPIASLNPRMTIREIVAEPLGFFRPEMDAEARRDAALAMLDRVGIPATQANRFPHEFSGGQCQRIGIARALVAEPKVLLCDEPVSALDVSIQAQVVNLLKALQREIGLALVFVAHDLGVVRHISDEVLVMYMGATMERAPAGALVRDPQHPYTRALLSAVPVPDPRVKVAPQMLEGDLPSPLDLPEGCLFRSRCSRAVAECGAARPPMVPTCSGEAACIRLPAPA